VADKDYRIRFIEKKYHLTPKQAIQMVNNEEKRRTNLYQKFGRLDYDSTAHYHLIVNMRRVTLESASGLMRRLVERIR
jgi:cytidylate kinase